MTVADFVTSRLKLETHPGLSKMMVAADRAQEAFRQRGETGIKQARYDRAVREKLADAISRSRDAYRTAQTYGPDGMSATLPTKTPDAEVRLSDWESPESHYVPIPGTNLRLVVRPDPERVVIESVISDRNRIIYRFADTLEPKIDEAFTFYFQGDDVDVQGDVTARIDRADSDAAIPVAGVAAGSTAPGEVAAARSAALPTAARLLTDPVYTAGEGASDKGQIVITSSPIDAEIFVDGAKAGIAPTQATLIAGEHIVEAVWNETNRRVRKIAVCVAGKSSIVQIIDEKGPR